MIIKRARNVIIYFLEISLQQVLEINYNRLCGSGNLLAVLYGFFFISTCYYFAFHESYITD